VWRQECGDAAGCGPGGGADQREEQPGAGDVAAVEADETADRDAGEEAEGGRERPQLGAEEASDRRR